MHTVTIIFLAILFVTFAASACTATLYFQIEPTITPQAASLHSQYI